MLIGQGLKRPAPPMDRHSWIAAELDLSPEQSEKMRAIWSDLVPAPATSTAPATAPTTATRPLDRRHQYQKERDDALAALVATLTPPQRAEYEKIMDRYNNQVADLGREREAAFQAAVEKTKAILSEAQKAKYEELLKKSPRGGPFGRGGSSRGATTRAHATTSTAPASQP